MEKKILLLAVILTCFGSTFAQTKKTTPQKTIPITPKDTKLTKDETIEYIFNNCKKAEGLNFITTSNTSIRLETFVSFYYDNTDKTYSLTYQKYDESKYYGAFDSENFKHK